MTKADTTLARLDVAALERLQAHGRKITHSPRCSANDALYALLGEYEKLKRRSRKAAIHGPPTVQEDGEQAVADAEQIAI